MSIGRRNKHMYITQSCCNFQFCLNLRFFLPNPSSQNFRIDKTIAYSISTQCRHVIRSFVFFLDIEKIILSAISFLTKLIPPSVVMGSIQGEDCADQWDLTVGDQFAERNAVAILKLNICNPIEGGRFFSFLLSR